VEDRQRRLAEVWRHVLGRLEAHLQPGFVLPEARSFARLKRFEDALDALVCAWVGIEHLAGRTRALGDGDAAIWSPQASR
jgi:predicted RNase H-like nuclease